MSDEQTKREQEPQGSAKQRRRRILLIVSAIVIAGGLYYLLPIAIVVFVLQPVRVEGMAMAPTLKNGDRILVSKRVGTIERGDIVIFYYPLDPTKSFIMRVIGLPGEIIGMDDTGNITINGQVIKDYARPEENRYALARWRQMRSEWKQIKGGDYFIMGDNRDVSNDSRSWGPVPRDLIYGKYWMRYWASGE